jgi:predicted DNA-binding transcriptional regulator AlpA
VPAEPTAAAPPAGGPELDKLLAALRQAIEAEGGRPIPLLLDNRGAWEFLGLSRSSWFRLKSSKGFPRPVEVEGVGPRYRRQDLEHWAGRLKASHRRTSRETTEG